MQRCLQLAKNGLGSVAPNPMVGSVIVHSDRIIGEGYHRRYGHAHAEVNAINAVRDKSLLKNSTLFVNLEPCSHHGKTPPCADLIVNSGIPKVVIAMTDPNEKVAGNGINRLKAAGIDVTVGICEKEAQFLNRRFITFHSKKRPYIILKWAQSADGFMDRDRSKNAARGVNWISHPETKKLVHLWRSQEQAILVGRKTVENDNPKLDTREVEGPSPLRIILSKTGNIPMDSHVVNDGNPTLIFNLLDNKNINETQWVKLDGNFLQSGLKHLFKMRISSVFVEGGKTTLSHFIEENLWDEARIIHSPVFVNSGLKAPILTSENTTVTHYGRDEIWHVYNF